jgi:hypothetical protein
MSTANAFLIIFGVLATLVLVVLVFIFRWEPESLIFWRNFTLALVFLELAVPPLLPPEIRWGDNANIFKAAVLLLLVAIGIKSLILFLKYRPSLGEAQKIAAWISMAPLILGLILAVFFILFVWIFSRTGK